MEEKLHLAYLYDFYGELLKPDAARLYRAFVFDDLSLQEIAEGLDVSRQAVHDRIKRSIRTMEGYEERLHLIAKYDAAMEQIEILKSWAGEKYQKESEDYNRINSLLNNIAEVF